MYLTVYNCLNNISSYKITLNKLGFQEVVFNYYHLNITPFNLKVKSNLASKHTKTTVSLVQIR